MLTIGDRFPDFQLKGVVSNDSAGAFRAFDATSAASGWRVFFFYPKDFTFVCPTEIAGFAKLDAEFRERDAQIFAVSTDSEFAHLAWRRSHEALRNLPFPMLSDLRRDLAEALGILDSSERVARRATFVVDPQGIIRYVSVYADGVGRNPEEVLRVLDALQTGELCPCNWQRGEATLKSA